MYGSYPGGSQVPFLVSEKTSGLKIRCEDNPSTNLLRLPPPPDVRLAQGSEVYGSISEFYCVRTPVCFRLRKMHGLRSGPETGRRAQGEAKWWSQVERCVLEAHLGEANGRGADAYPPQLCETAFPN